MTESTIVFIVFTAIGFLLLSFLNLRLIPALDAKLLTQGILVATAAFLFGVVEAAAVSPDRQLSLSLMKLGIILVLAGIALSFLTRLENAAARSTAEDSKEEKL